MKKLTCILALLLLCTAGGRKKERIETPQKGAVLQMGFNEGPGAKDWSNAENAGVVVGATWSAANGIVGGGFKFDGTNDYIILPYSDFSSLSEGSISVWFYSEEAPSTSKALFDVSDGGDAASMGGLYNYQSYPALQFFVYEASSPIVSLVTPSNSISYNQWCHGVVTVGSEGTHIYINGNDQTLTEVQGTASSAAFFDDIKNIDSAVIGTSKRSNAYQSNRMFNGKIDEVRVYNRALSEDEVKQLYQTGEANQNP
jgi:hypothetical protein